MTKAPDLSYEVKVQQLILGTFFTPLLPWNSMLLLPDVTSCQVQDVSLASDVTS